MEDEAVQLPLPGHTYHVVRLELGIIEVLPLGLAQLPLRQQPQGLVAGVDLDTLLHRGRARSPGAVRLVLPGPYQRVDVEAAHRYGPKLLQIAVEVEEQPG